MDIRAESYSEANHYSTLKAWWDDWKLPAAPPSFLPDGYIIFIDNEPMCAGFLYQLGRTPMFWIEGIVSNKNAALLPRLTALRELSRELTAMAKAQGCELLMGSTPREGLRDIFIGEGFGQAPERYFHIARRI